ncbi:UNVERIFIED_CONTAM: Increased DNA methylation 1 [Sesamum radiatum]|uniref:Increased DNA methylation 1 n=1 Tax=Sesamum radiatum TaxID=300843 RepID=A0AAW2SKM0_SESRA
MRRKRKEDGMAKTAKGLTVRKVADTSDSDQNDERLSSYMKQNHKSRRGKMSKVDHDSDDDSSEESPKKKPVKVRVSKPLLSPSLVSYREEQWKKNDAGWLIDSGTVQLSEKVQYMNRRRTRCQIDAWNNQEELLRQDFHTVDVDGDDPDDDTCGICGDGGDLMCCDSCPSTFHQVCLDIQVLPSGDWHCPNCTCKFCGYARVNAAEENDNADDHTSCSDGVHALPMSSDGASFCGLKCRELHDHFQKILGVKHELEAGLSWSLIQRTDVSDASQRSFPQRVECNSKLAVALSNFNRLNYRGFYTAILERSDEIISAASIRLHGTRLAEMPFIGTRDMYRRQGMCRRLLSAIETELCSLKVEQLIIPAISEHMNTWTTVFGFDELEDLHKKEIKSMNMLVFPGTDMLQKQLVKPENSDGDKISDSTKNQPQSPISVKNSHSDSSSEQNGQASNDSGCCDEFKTNDEVGVLSSGSPAPATPSNDNTTASPSDATGEADAFLASQGAVVKPEVENERKESSANLKCFPTPAESNNGTDMEHQLLDPPAKDKADSAEATIGNTCKTGTPCQESASVQVNADCSVNVSEDSNPGNTPSNGSVESQPGFVCETSVKSSTDKVNGEPDATSCQTTVSNEHFNLGPSAPVMNSKLHSSMEPSPDSAATHDARVDGADDNNRCDGRASCYDPKVSTAQLTPGPSSEVSAKDSSQSANDSSQTTNENQNPALISASHDVQESNMTCNTSSDHNTETDKPDGEIEPSCGVVQKVASPNASRDALAENTATIENHQNQVTADRNGNAAA